MKENIKQALINAMLHYFNEMKSKISVDKHSFMEESFDKKKRGQVFNLHFSLPS